MAELVGALNSFTPDALIGGTEVPALTKIVTLLAGSGTVVRGTVLGKITKGATTASSAAKSGGNTGNGTLTLDATTPVLSGVQAGVYTARVIRKALAAVATTPEVAAQKALVELKDPQGNILEVFDLATSSGNTISNQVKFVMVEGATLFEVGDGFDITVAIAAGSGKYVIVNSANTNGSEEPDCVLTQDIVVAADTDSKVEVYTQGYFNGDQLTFGGSDTYSTHREALRAKNIILTNEQ